MIFINQSVANPRFNFRVLTWCAEPCVIALLLFVLMMLGLRPYTLHAQNPSSTESPSVCADWVCESLDVVRIALDSLHRADGSLCAATPPTVLRTIRSSPVPRRDGSLASEIGTFDDLPTIRLVLKGPVLVVIDSADAFDSQARLPEGRCIFGVSPVQWRGEDVAQLHVFRHFGPFGQGTEFFVWLRSDGRVWQIERIVTGRYRDVAW